MLKVGLDDYLVHQGAEAFEELVKHTPYDTSLLELQEHSVNLLNFADKYEFKFRCDQGIITFVKQDFKLLLEGSGNTRLVSLYVNDGLTIKENLNLAVGTKKDNFVKRCHLDENQSKELRRFLDVAFEFTLLHSEVAQKELEIRKEIKEKFPVALSISQKKRDKALEVAKSPDLLYRVRKALDKLGLVGEFLNGLLLYLALTSRLLEKPISIVVKAGSSAGKSYLIKIVLELFPSEAYFELTGLSSKALVYLAESFSHRFLVIYEIHGIEEDYLSYLIRTLLSENRIRYAVVEKNEFDEHETRIIEREGPTGLITTTTQPNIHDENETRLFSISVSEAREQTRNIKDKLAGDYQEIQAERDKSEIEDLINLQRIIEPLPVRIPYAKVLAELTPDEPIRMRRDFQRILAVIEVIALLHQHQREVKEMEGIKYIEAQIEDYYIAKALLEEPLNLTLRNKYPQTIELVKAVEEIYRKRNKPVLVKELHQRFKKSKKTITRWLYPALDHGWIENVGEKGQGKPFELVPGQFEDEGIEISLLPTVETLFEKFPEQAQGFVVIDPITGERITSEEG